MAFRWPWARAEQRTITHDDLPWSTGESVGLGDGMESALRLVPVFAAVKLLSEGVALCPIGTYRRVTVDGKPRDVQIGNPPVFEDPTMFGTSFEWTQRLVTSLLLRGEATGLVTSFDGMGYPQRIEWLNPADVSIDDDRAITRPRWRYLGQPVEPWLGRDSGGQLVHIPWFVLPGYVRGMSPIGVFRQTIEGGLAASKFNRDFFDNGAIPSGVIETPADATGQTPEASKILKARFKAAARNREPVVLGKGAKYNAITIKPEDAQLVESLKLNATQIAAIYGVEPEDVGGEKGGSLEYNTPLLRDLAFARRSLNPIATKIQAHLSTLRPRPQYVQIDTDAYAKADLLTRYRANVLALKWMDRDEVREGEGLEPAGERPEPTNTDPAEGGEE